MINYIDRLEIQSKFDKIFELTDELKLECTAVYSEELKDINDIDFFIFDEKYKYEELCQILESEVQRIKNDTIRGI